jgi:hypothetical protein
MQKLTSLFFVLLCFTAATSSVWAQTSAPPEIPETISKMTPPSPNAAALGKYGDIPVSLHTGTPNINIPLYNLQSRELSLPISLSYHASGIKVDEIASWVGLGWSLNAGGVIARTMRGMPDDEHSNGYLNTQFDVPNNTEIAGEVWIDPNNVGTSNFFNDLLTPFGGNKKDLLPDIFNFNFNGHSGKFVFDQNGKVHILSQQNLKITPTFGVVTDGNNVYAELISFEVIDENGITYTFAERERTEPLVAGPDNGYFSSWYLTEIRDTETGDNITLTYVEETTVVQHNSWSSMTLYFQPTGTPPPIYPDWVEPTNEIKHCRAT